MTFEKPGEVDFWMRVYVAVAGCDTVAHPTDPSIWADQAIEELRERIPAERPEGSQCLWPPRPEAASE
jgi:hypothetical protein